MQKLLSLPPNLVEAFSELEHVNTDEWFCTSDPVGMKLGSGGGTTWLLRQWEQHRSAEVRAEKRILFHAGGQSRRLPSYAPSGKILTPLPVFRWARGQQLGQNLLSLQLPLYEKIMERAPESLRTLIASGDVYIRAEKPLQDIPEADVVCYGLWVDPVLATHHGVFVSNRQTPEVLDFMLQKPSLAQLEDLSQTHLFLMDIGIWLLSDRAVELLKKRSLKAEGPADPAVPWSDLRYYDLYSDFGLALGANPRIADDELNALSVAILPLPGGEFYHYGTSRELLSSTVALQGKVADQRRIMHRKVKPSASIFTQNAEVGVKFTEGNDDVWIENSCVPFTWAVGARQIITGVPHNDWTLALTDGTCIDIVPLQGGGWAVRPYGFDDAFKGALDAMETYYLNTPFFCWLNERGLTLDDLSGRHDDLQAASIFPVVHDVETMGRMVRWMTEEPDLEGMREVWLQAERLSADEISARADLRRLCAQREAFARKNWELLATNYEKTWPTPRANTIASAYPSQLRCPTMPR